MQGRQWKLLIPDWHPVPLNKLLTCHWATAARRKATDRHLIGAYCLLNHMPLAQGPRRVDLVITLGPRQRGCDPDAYWKASLDALVDARMLVDDRRQYCKPGEVTFDRAMRRGTTIILTDLYEEPA